VHDVHRGGARDCGGGGEGVRGGGDLGFKVPGSPRIIINYLLSVLPAKGADSSAGQ
jgi:hypothetical protein